jgi:hypothetical protein
MLDEPSVIDYKTRLKTITSVPPGEQIYGGAGVGCGVKDERVRPMSGPDKPAGHNALRSGGDNT